MFKNFKILKRYYKQINVKPILLIFEFLFLLIPSVLSILMPIVSANIISCITVFNYNKAIFWLCIEFAFIVISAISYFSYHLISKKVNKTISLNIHTFVYDNIKRNKNITKVPSSIHANISSYINFNKDFLYKICFFIKSVVLLSIIIYFNVLIGISLIIVSIISFLLLRLTDTKIQKNSLALSKFRSESMDLFNNIYQGEKIEANYNLEPVLRDKYFKYIDSEIKTDNKISLYYNINNNFISLILKTTVFVFTIYLIGLVKNTTLTLSLYLILTPYLTSSAQNLIAFYELFSEFGLIDNVMLELGALEFTETIQEKPTNLSTFNLYFYEIIAEHEFHKLNNFSLKINFCSAINFVGDKNCGKRLIFSLLQREIKPVSGVVLLDNKNIYDINNEDYKKTISFTTKNSFFYNVSVLENLLLVCENKTKILNGLKSFGLKSDIDNLPNKMNTILSPKKHKHLLYFLSIFRCFISGAKIINIYEFPETFSRSDYEKLSKIISFLKTKTTIIVYSHSDILAKYMDMIYYIESGEIKNNKN